MKKVVFVASCIAIAVAGVLGVHKFNSDELACSDLLIENVEALTRGEVGGSNGCSTSITYVNNMIKCLICKTYSGRNGTQYTCRSNGDAPTCQSGFNGNDTFCNCSYRPMMSVNNVETIPCSN